MRQNRIAQLQQPYLGPVNQRGVKPTELLSEEQIDYYMKLKHIINPHSKDFYTVYGAAGPDLATALLAADATKVLALDYNRVKENSLRVALAKENFGFRGDEKYIFDTGKQSRYEYGLWTEDDIREAGVERLIAYELRKLGVTDGDIKHLSSNATTGELKLKFMWAYPSSPQKKLRDFTFKWSRVPRDFDDIDFSGVNLYLQKAANNSHKAQQILHLNIHTLEKGDDWGGRLVRERE